jgi:hypothetical protein
MWWVSKMVTWIEEGKFYGKSPWTCDTRHDWRVGVTPDIVSKDKAKGLPLPKKEMWDQVVAYESQLVIELEAYDTSGWTTKFQKTSVTNSMVANITHFNMHGKVLESPQQYIISNQYPTNISLNGKGKYRVVLEPLEAGEGCVIPKGKKTIYFTITQEIETEPVYQPQSTTPTEIETQEVSAPLFIIGATGIMLVISSFFKKKPKDEVKSLSAEDTECWLCGDYISNWKPNLPIDEGEFPECSECSKPKYRVDITYRTVEDYGVGMGIEDAPELEKGWFQLNRGMDGAIEEYFEKAIHSSGSGFGGRDVSLDFSERQWKEREILDKVRFLCHNPPQGYIIEARICEIINYYECDPDWKNCKYCEKGGHLILIGEFNTTSMQNTWKKRLKSGEITQKEYDEWVSDIIYELGDNEDFQKAWGAEERIRKVGLVKGRHEMPATEFVYDEIILDENFSDTILDGLPAQSRYWMNRNLPGTDKLELYITGFAPALTAFLIEWNKAQPDCELILMHYNAQNGEYVKQLYEMGTY